MGKRRYLILPIVTLGLVLGIRGWDLIGAGPMVSPVPALVDAPAADPYHDLTGPSEGVLVRGVDTTDVDRRIAFWQERVELAPRSETAWTYVGDLLDQKGRQTGDVSQYSAAKLAYETALEIAPMSSGARSGLARILATLHDFTAALDEAAAVLEADPAATGALGVMFDASLELGNLDRAAQALALLKERADGPPVRVREARLAFVNGRPLDALMLARQALDEVAGRGGDAQSVAFYHFTVAEYAMLAGDLDAAEAAYGAALRSLPGYVLAIAGEGRVAYARGDLATAIDRFETAVAALPRPDLVAYLGDLHALAGNDALADDQYALVDFIAGLGGTAPERVYDREYVYFLADHGRDPMRAVELARRELETRQDIYGHDALAWALLADSQPGQALIESRAALALGTADARLFAHAGLIELANGLGDEGRAHLQQALELRASLSPLVIERIQAALAQ
jgi:tetratricopeptide (TPR) repeat protein